jgi:hypothetical protein
MKIQIIKKGTVRVSSDSICPYLIDVPPENRK